MTEEIEKIENWVEDLRKDSRKKIVIVEGKKDKECLEKYNIKNIFVLKTPTYKTIDLISDKFEECILLVDLDKEGKKIYHNLSFFCHKSINFVLISF